MPREEERGSGDATGRLLAAAGRHGRILTRVAGALLLAAVASASAVALTPGLFAQRIPYDERDLGGPTAVTYKASRDYAIPDEETTRRMREEAVASVRAVYDHDAGGIEAALTRIHDGFAFARSELEKAEAPAPDGGDAPKLRKGKPESLRQEDLEPHRQELERRLESRLEDADLAALAGAGFAPPVEEAVAGLVARVMRELVVADREELSQHRDRGIAIRRLAATAHEEVLSEIGGIRDLAQVRAQVQTDARSLEPFPPALREAIGALARREIRSNLEYSADLTRKRREDAAEAVKPVVIQLRKGEKIIGAGERIGQRHLLIFAGIREQIRSSGLAQVRVGALFLVALLILVLRGYARSGLRPFGPRFRDAALLAFVLVASLILANGWTAVADVLRDSIPPVPLEAWTYAIPLVAGAMVVRAALGADAALLFAVLLSALVGVIAGGSLPAALIALVGSLTAAARVAGARERWAIFRAGAWSGAAQAAAVVCFALYAGKLPTWDVLVSAGAAFAGAAVLAPLLVIVVTPALERIFGYVTDVRLLEVANLNHPALKELIVQAPGTYHHSIIMGTLVEAAAQEIGASPILAKVCAYYHDLGKSADPLTFGENQKGDNRHERLVPEESARLILRHVEVGLALARKHRLPAPVVAAIPEHHGTSLVGYFFHKALKERQERPDLPEVDPARFRYPGPRPQSRETALVMLADVCEAAIRNVPDPDPERLEALVRKLIDGVVADGQLDETELTLRDLAAITRSFCRTLTTLYRVRPEDPERIESAEEEPRRFLN